MAEQSNIEWCDSTFNLWIGCTKVSPACDHCYAAVATPTRAMGIEWGAGKPRHRTSEENWKLPLRWNKKKFYECATCGWRGDKPSGDELKLCPACPTAYVLQVARRRVFCSSLSDWLDNEVPIEWLVDLLDLIRLTPNLDWLLLSKRVGNWNSRIAKAAEYMKETDYGKDITWTWIKDWLQGRPPENVWMGITVINQEEADRDIPKLLQVPAAIRFLSIEPMLGPITFEGRWVEHDNPALHHNWLDVLDWIICGGESGPDARPMHADWVRSLRDQCLATRARFFFKQWGEWAPNWFNDNEGNKIAGSEWMDRQGKKTSGRELDRRTHTEWPMQKVIDRSRSSIPVSELFNDFFVRDGEVMER